MLSFALMAWVCVSVAEPERSGPKSHVSRAERWVEITEVGFNAEQENSPLRSNGRNYSYFAICVVFYDL